jgi:ribosome maturation factor RimP
MVTPKQDHETIERRVHPMIDIDTIVQSVEPAVSALGLELYDVEINGAGRARVLRVLVDREGGIDLEGIAAATDAVSPLLDAPPLDTAIPGPYALEVSSPGLERPLRTAAHFTRASGETISVKTRAHDDEPARRVRGVVGDASDSGFDLVLDDGSNEHLDYADVAQARTVFEWGPQPKRGKAKSTKSSSAKSRSTREPVRP